MAEHGNIKDDEELFITVRKTPSSGENHRENKKQIKDLSPIFLYIHRYLHTPETDIIMAT